MSSSLVRQALEFVDPEETQVKEKKRRVDTIRPQSIGQVPIHRNKQKSKTQNKSAVLKEKLIEENIKKLLALSAPSANKAVAEKIVQRAIKGKPLLENKIEVKATEEKSILFPEDNIKTPTKAKRLKKQKF